MTAYRGFDVLEVEPDRADGSGVETTRKIFMLDSVTGKRTVATAEGASGDAREFAWLAFSRSEAATLRAFLDARRGRAVPCWLPAWEEDFTLTQAVAPDTYLMVVISSGYALTVFPAGEARRHLAIRLPGGVTYYRHVAGAQSFGDGTEGITLEQTIPVALPVGTLISFLVFARLDEDMATIEWVGQFAECRLRFRELTAEAPA